MDTMNQVKSLIERGALFIVNHSGGKDSQAMYLLIRDLVPASQIVIVHADLGDVEWTNVQAHITATTDGHPLRIASAIYKDGTPKSLLGEWKRKGKAPSSSQRWCTSDLKRGPLEKLIRRIMAERGSTLAVNCMGLRAQESRDRAKKIQFEKHEKLSVAGREVWSWLPIHTMTTVEVFAAIAAAGQEPHAMYAKGMTRLSCCFCIMASQADLTTAAKLNPELYAKYVAMEKATGFTLRAKKGLEEVTGIKAKDIA
jgi:3'-phosphoadenosine 5'-phosphosulfate sulfotransferase (PAPS reductase)/FAD synthetase